VCLLPVLVLTLQGTIAWLFFGTATAAWDKVNPGLPVESAATRVLLLFTAAGPIAMVLLAWGIHTLYSRSRVLPAIGTSLLYLPSLLVAGILTWTLLVLNGWL